MENKNLDLTDAKSENIEDAATQGSETVENMESQVSETVGSTTSEVSETVGGTVAPTPEIPTVAAAPVGAANDNIMAAPAKSRKTLPIIIISAVAVVVIAVVALFVSGVFAKPADKVLMGIGNTFIGDEFTDQISGLQKITEDGIYTVGMNINASGSMPGNISAKLDSAQDSKTGTQSIKGNIDVMGRSFAISEFMDDKTITVAIPELLGEAPVSYNYTEPKTGYIASIADPSEIEMIDEYLKYIHTSLSMDKTDMTEKMLKVLKDDLATLKFKKAAPKTIEFENGSVNCKGYSAVIDSKFMRKLFDDLKAVYGDDEFEAYLKSMDQLSKYSTSTNSIKSLEELYEEIDNIPETTVNFYLNKKNLVGIEFTDESGDSTILEFAGSKVPWHLTRIKGKESSLTMKVTVKGTEEKFEFSDEDNATNTFTIDTKSGDFTFKSEYSELKGVFKADGDKYTFKVDVEGVSIEFTVSDGAKVEKVEGKPLDIGNAGEQQIMDLMNHISAVLMG